MNKVCLLNGSEDHCLGKIDNNIIIATGFCDGCWAALPPRYFYNKMITGNKRGFIKDIYSYNLTNDKIKKIGILPHNFHPRQYSGSIVLNNKYYIFGGYSYTPLTNTELEKYKRENIPLPSKSNIFTYNDSICITYKNNELVIKKSIQLPYPMCGFNIIRYKNKIYFFGGMIYTGNSFNCEIKFNNVEIGCSFFSMDIDNNGDIIENSVEFINNFKVTGRFTANVYIYEDNMYVIGGTNANTKITNNDKGYCENAMYNVMDNWKYNFISKKWIKISNKKFPLINHGSILYKNNIILLGGVYHPRSIYCNKLIDKSQQYQWPDLKHRITDLDIETNVIKTPQNKIKFQHFSNLIMVYDILKDTFYLSKYKLPLNISLPGVIRINETIYLLGGEANSRLLDGIYYGNCSSFTMKILIKEVLQ